MIPWQQMNPFISRTFPLLSGGRELFGTVIKHGKMDKTVTVKCDFKHWNGYGQCVMKSTSKFLVHNTNNFAISGDKVIIQYAGGKISPRKHYYIRNIVYPFPRMQLQNQQIKEEQSMLQTIYKEEYRNFVKNDTKIKSAQNPTQKNQIIKTLKAKAMKKAIEKLRKLESQQSDDKKENILNQDSIQQQKEIDNKIIK